MFLSVGPGHRAAVVPAPNVPTSSRRQREATITIDKLSMTVSTTPNFTTLTAVLTGIAVPGLVFGRSVMAVPLVLAVVILLCLPRRGDYWRMVLERARTPIGVIMLVTLALWLPSMAVSPLPLRSLEAWIRVPVFIGLIGLLWAMLSEPRGALTPAIKALLVGGAAAAAFAVIALTILPNEFLSFIRLRGWNPMNVRKTEILKEFASAAILMIPVIVWAGRRLGGRWRALAVATAIGLLAVVWLTINRAAVAGLFAMLVVVGGLMVAARRNLTVTAAVSVGLVVVSAALLLWLHATRGHIIAPEGAVAVLPTWLLDWQRQTIWARTIDMAMNSPWVGNGINVVNLLPGAEERLFTSKLHVIPAHPHNWLFEVFAETGVIGVLALLTLVVTLCVKLAGDYLEGRDTAVLAALMVSVGYWGSGLLNVSFWSAWWQICYLLMMAFCLAGREPACEGARFRSPST